MFQFEKDPGGICRLALFPTAELPDAASFLSYAVNRDDFDPPFFDPNVLRIIGPVLPELPLTVAPIQCIKSVDNTLACAITYPDHPTLNILAIAPNNGELFISSYHYYDTSPIFNLIPVL